MRQLKPGPRPGSHRVAPPGLPTQKTFRADPAFLERVEERALEESLRTGRNVRFSQLVRRGLEMVLASELPGYVRGPRVPCGLVRTASGGLACVECHAEGGERKGSIVCPRLCREVTLSE